MSEEQRPNEPQGSSGNFADSGSQPSTGGAAPEPPASDMPTVQVPYIPPTPPVETTVPEPSAATAEATGGIGGWSTQKKILAGCGGLLLLCVILAICSGVGLYVASTLDEDDPTPTLAVIQPTATHTATATVTMTLAPTSTPSPTATTAETPTTVPTETTADTTPTFTIPPTTTIPSSPGLEILDVGAGQEAEGQEVGWSFIVQNSDTTQGIELSEYSVLLKNAAGVVIDSDEGFISLLFPGETVGVSGTIFLDEGLEASTIEVEVNAGSAVDVPESGGFSISQAIYFHDESFPTVTGLVENTFDVAFNDLRISAVPYDADGNIIGGGFTFMDIAPASGSAGVDVSITTSQEPASIVLYASISGLTEPHEAAPTDIVVTKSGFGQDDTTVGWGAILQNPTADMQVENPIYQVTFFDVEGRVVAVDSSTLITILGGEMLGVGDDLVFVPEGVQVASIQVDVLSGELAPDIDGRFSYSDVQYVPDDFFPTVTGVVTNPFDRQLDELNAFAILYDEAGNIIGGGRTFMDPIPAGGQTLADISVTGSAVPASVEIYATFSFLTEL